MCGEISAVRRSSVAIVIVLATLAVESCARKRVPLPGTLATSGATSIVEWAGCLAEAAGPRCRLALNRTLTIWTSRRDGGRLIFAADGRPFGHRDAETMQDGWQVTLEVPAGARQLTVTGPDGGPLLLVMAIEAASGPSSVDRLVTAGKEGDLDATARLRELATHAEPSRRGPAEAGLGRVMLARGRMNEAEPDLRAALVADRAEGRLSDEMRDGAALIWGLVVLEQRFADARAVLASMASTRDRFPEGSAWYRYSEGLLDAETNDLRGALSSYRAVTRIAERLALTHLANDAAEDLAQIFVVLGRSAEATTILDRLPSKADPCAQASLMINRAEALEDAATRVGRAAEARVEAVLAEERRATDACPEPHRRLLALVDAARYALAIDDAPTADALAGDLRSDDGAKDALAQAWRADVLGRWSLARGHAAEALTRFEEQAEIARAAGLREERFRAEVGAGESLLALSRRAAGIARLKMAQALLERTLDGIPLTEGRGGFLSSHDEAARHLVDALVDGGAVSEGMAVARFTRTMEMARAARLDRLQRLSGAQRSAWDQALERYAGIRRAVEGEAASDWTLPASALAGARTEREIRAARAREALDSAYRLLVDLPSPTRPAPPPGPGQVQITFFRAARSWIAFARTQGGVRARRFPEQALLSAANASALLEQISPELAGAHEVVILALGLADQVDWHALTWRGQPLIARAKVAYSLDLPHVMSRTPEGPADRRALVVTNPTGDLAATAAEGDFVARSLDGWSVDSLSGHAATRDELLARLPTVGLFHYAGHATAGAQGGGSSALVLADGQRLELGDLLALPRVPDVVVLSACRAGAGGGLGPEGGSTSMMGLAQAFLAAGAKAVVAPIRDVADTEARNFVVSFYRALGAGVGEPTQAFRRAALAAVGKDSQSFRLVVR
jgi:hypothetical protein